MKKLFLLFALLLGANAAMAHDVEVDGIFYDLYYFKKVAYVTYKGDFYDSFENEYTGTVVIPESITVDGVDYSVTSLGARCFDRCSGLTAITIPKSVTKLENNCFYRCSGLTAITIPKSVTKLGNNCFTACSGLESIVVESGNTVYDSREDCNAIIETATNTMITGCRNTKIPNSVTSLGDYCFFYCTGLTSIAIPNSVTSLGDRCFSGCSYGLESIVVESGNTVYDSREDCNAIIETATNTMITGCKNTKIPNSVTSLGYECFFYCTGLTSIAIPNSVTSLGDWCFSYCTGLTSITIPNSVTEMGYQCMSCCNNLTSITIPNSVTNMIAHCFYGNTVMTEAHINRETPPSLRSGYKNNGDPFIGCPAFQTIYVPRGASANYDRSPWNAYKIVEEDVQSGITAVMAEGEATAPVYHLNGRRAGTTENLSAMPKGIYIANGKKVLR